MKNFLIAGTIENNLHVSEENNYWKKRVK